MKKFNLLFVALIGASALTFTSCTDECKDVVCDNGGTCDEETGACDCPANFYGESCETECINGTYSGGACSCDDGYEGDACGVEQREKFLGSYRSTTDCLSATYASTVGVSSTDVTTIIFSNLGNSGITANATVTGSTSFSFDGDSTTDSFGDNVTITGSGNVNADGNQIQASVTYTFEGFLPNTCVETFNVQ